MTAWYNEIDPFAAQWLRNLIAAGLIAPGDVDERDIRDVRPEDLRGYTQCHFFAGIGGWSLALRLAGWPDDRPVWTGSPPCQPFSLAGHGLGKRDERHLAPVWLDLIRGCRPPTVLGENVAAATSKDEWLDDLQDALEAEDYATGAVVLPACGVGAPHIRQRLFFIAHRRSVGVSGPVKAGSSREIGSWWTCSAEDLQSVIRSPFARRGGIPQPLIRSMDDGIPTDMDRLRAIGNAIVPQVAAEVIQAFMEVAP